MTVAEALTVFILAIYACERVVRLQQAIDRGASLYREEGS